MHYNLITSKYTVVRTQKGGGNRKLILPNTTTKEDIFKEARQLFFPNEIGGWHDMIKDIGNYQGHVIRDDFILDGYVKKHKLTKTRLYILTRFMPLKKQLVHVSDDDDDFIISDYYDPNQISNNSKPNSVESEKPTITNNPSLATSSSPDNNVSSSSITSGRSSGLIGSSSEREKLFEEMDNAYQESLRIDRQKTQQKEIKEEEEKKNIELKQQLGPGHDTKLLGVDGTPSALVGIYLGEGSL